MGTWSTEIFGNDEAFHWLNRLEQTEGWALVRQSLEEVLTAGNQYIEIDQASGALAAAEVVAQRLGHPGSSELVADRIAEWLEFDCQQALPSDLAHKAQLVVQRILQPPCEALEGWQSSADLDEWQQHVRALHHRLVL